METPATRTALVYNSGLHVLGVTRARQAVRDSQRFGTDEFRATARRLFP